MKGRNAFASTNSDWRLSLSAVGERASEVELFSFSIALSAESSASASSFVGSTGIAIFEAVDLASDWNVFERPSMPGFRNSNSDHSSPKWFSTGVPVMASR